MFSCGEQQYVCLSSCKPAPPPRARLNYIRWACTATGCCNSRLCLGVMEVAAACEEQDKLSE